MIKILIIADDFTGALDTGIQFAQEGVSTVVVNDIDYDFSQTDAAVELVVINTTSRHLHPDDAYALVYRIAKRAVEHGVLTLYKKTDSVLRGCVGSELAAVLDASGSNELHFIPALPRAGRTTEGGVQYLNGIAIHKTVFGQDPFEPVSCSEIPSLIAAQSSVAVEIVPIGAKPVPKSSEKRILVYDAVTESDVRSAAKTAKLCDEFRAIGGCSGLAAVLPQLMELTLGNREHMMATQGLLVVSGSLNPITGQQLDYAAENGFMRIQLTPEQKLAPGYLSSHEGIGFLETLRDMCRASAPVMLDTFCENGMASSDAYAANIGLTAEQARVQVASRLGEIVTAWLDFGFNHTVMMTGGDTLLGFMECSECSELMPVCEIIQGVVLSKLTLRGRTLQIISKSGGFGTESTFVEVANLLNKNSTQKEESLCRL